MLRISAARIHSVVSRREAVAGTLMMSLLVKAFVQYFPATNIILQMMLDFFARSCDATMLVVLNSGTVVWKFRIEACEANFVKLLGSQSGYASMLVSNVIFVLFWAGADGHGLDVNLGAICGIRPSKIPDLCFQPMVFAAQGFECQKWNNILSVGLWSQANITAITLKHQLCSHTTNESHGQQRSWNCLYACKNIRSCNAIGVEYSFLMISADTMFKLPDDHLVEDVILAPFGLCHQRWTTTSWSLIPKFNGGDLLRLSSVMVP